MMRNHKVTGKTLSMPVGLTIGTAICILLTVLISIVISKLISIEKIEWNQVGYGVMIMLLIASIAGAKTACTIIRRRKLIICASIGGLYWLSLLVITALFFDGQYNGMGLTGLIILCGGALVYIMEMKREGRRKGGFGRRRKK